MSPKVYVVIGKNFGDEGKGQMVDLLASGAESRVTVISRDGCDTKDESVGKCLVVRHNGGAQSGHTVVRQNFQDFGESRNLAGETRFVFHELGAGSFAGADTLWTDTFFPDLYKLNEEYAAFHALSGAKSSVFSIPETPITTVDDVLLNMALEKSRGSARHGSCGMGIYEAYLRTKAGFGITVGDVKNGGEKELYNRIKKNRDEYVLPRIKQLSNVCDEDLQEDTCHDGCFIDRDKCGEIISLLEEDNVLRNAARQMFLAVEKVELVYCDDVRAFLEKYDRVIFETGQGLLLDSENEEYAPHVTGSRTGLTNPVSFTNRFGLKIDEVIYVTRSYVTRHGAGLLKHECDRRKLGITFPDSTNITNEWQGDFRYAPHVSIEEFLKAPRADFEESLQNQYRPKVALAITHLSETDNKILFAEEGKNGETVDGSGFRGVSVEELFDDNRIREIFIRTYCT